MEIERINKDTLKVVVSKKDLNRHGLNFLDILGNHEQIEKFFLNILEEADTYNEFRGEEDSLTFQVLPNDTGLEILIKKNDESEVDPDESDSLNDFDIWDEQSVDPDDGSSNSDNVKEASDHLFDYAMMNRSNSPKKNTSFNNQDAIEKIVEYDNFEDVIKVAHLLNIYNGASNLYLYNGHYYLDLIFFLNIDGSSEDMVNNNLAIAFEYGNLTNITVDVLSENAKKLMSTSALELIRYYFK